MPRNVQDTRRLSGVVRTRHVARFNKAGVDVGPVETPVHMVNGKAVGTTNLGDESRPLAAVQCCTLDSRYLAPVTPVHPPGGQH